MPHTHTHAWYAHREANLKFVVPHSKHTHTLRQAVQRLLCPPPPPLSCLLPLLLAFCGWCSVTWNLWTPFRLYAIVKINCHNSLRFSHCKLCLPSPSLLLSLLSYSLLCMFWIAACYHSTTGHVSFVSNTRVTSSRFLPMLHHGWSWRSELELELEQKKWHRHAARVMSSTHATQA